MAGKIYVVNVGSNASHNFVVPFLVIELLSLYLYLRIVSYQALMGWNIVN